MVNHRKRIRKSVKNSTFHRKKSWRHYTTQPRAHPYYCCTHGTPFGRAILPFSYCLCRYTTFSYCLRHYTAFLRQRLIRVTDVMVTNVVVTFFFIKSMNCFYWLLYLKIWKRTLLQVLAFQFLRIPSEIQLGEGGANGPPKREFLLSSAGLQDRIVSNYNRQTGYSHS